MGALNIWNAMEVAEGARDSYCSGIPSSTLTVDHSLSITHMKPRIRVVQGSFQEMVCGTVSGGITNLYLTVRLYGPNTLFVINRERELQAIPYLSAAGFGAKLLGVFGNGMVQSFINARTLTPTEMRQPKLAAEIAKQLCKFHQVEIPGSREPQLWTDIFKFYGKASSLSFDDYEKQKKYETISFHEIQNELIRT